MARLVAVVFLLACAAISTQGQSTLAGDGPASPMGSSASTSTHGDFTGGAIDPPTDVPGGTPIPGTVDVNGTVPAELREDNKTVVESTVPPTCASDCVATTCDASAACVNGECVRTYKTSGSGCADIEGFTGYCSAAVSAENGRIEEE